MSIGREVHDRQPPVAERETALAVHRYAAVVGTAVQQRIRHAPRRPCELVGRQRSPAIPQPRNPAHRLDQSPVRVPTAGAWKPGRRSTATSSPKRPRRAPRPGAEEIPSRLAEPANLDTLLAARKMTRGRQLNPYPSIPARAGAGFPSIPPARRGDRITARPGAPSRARNPRAWGASAAARGGPPAARPGAPLRPAARRPSPRGRAAQPRGAGRGR